MWEGVHCFGDKRETQTVTQVEHCFIFILCFLWFYMSGHVAEPRQNAKVRTKALPARGNAQRPLSKANMKGRDEVLRTWLVMANIFLPHYWWGGG